MIQCSWFGGAAAREPFISTERNEEAIAPGKLKLRRFMPIGYLT
jgi:hypothetical protein